MAAMEPIGYAHTPTELERERAHLLRALALANTQIAQLSAALKNSEAQQDWIAQRLHDFVTNKAVDEWQEAMTQLAEYIEARKAP